MKTILSKLTDQQAQNELKRVTLTAFALSAISLIIFWFLGMAGLALGVRSFLLTMHKGNKDDKNLLWYRAASVFAIIAGALSAYVGINQN